MNFTDRRREILKSQETHLRGYGIKTGITDLKFEIDGV